MATRQIIPHPREPLSPQLLQQSEKILLHPIHAHLISYCPTMDLIAVVTSEENLDVYRINGQRAFGLKRKSEDVHVLTICWQWNGAAIGVCWSDGAVDVVGVETGRVVHRDVRLPGLEGGMGDGDDEATRVRCLGWGVNFIDAETVKRRVGVSRKRKVKGGDRERRPSGGVQSQETSPIAAKVAPPPKKTVIDFEDVPTTEDWDEFKDDTILEDFLQRRPDFETLDIAPDLPDQLAMMDTESLLPKLPPIPLPPANPFMMRAAQADAGAFSSQAQVDSLLHSHHLRDHNSVDMFIRCTEKGTVHPSIYDSMETVDIRLPEAWGVQSKPLAHTSHPYACTHGLLMEIKAPGDEKKKIAYVPLTLGFIPSAGIYLHLIASKTAQLQNLLSYLTHALSRIRSYFTHSQDLPGKFMRNITETLAEKAQGGLVENLYHLACTGHCSPALHEWLVDELAEQGHKRWDNAISSNLATVIQLVHENLLPAIDRCSIIISRLRGLAAYHDRDWIFSGPLSDFSALLEQLKCLRILGHTALLYAADEKRHFASFSKWLRYCIDFEATEPESQSRVEMEAKDPDVPIATVLSYIEHNMAQSDLAPFLRSSKDVDETAATTGGEASYEETVKAIEQRREGVPHRGDALCLDRVLQGFGRSVGALLRQVSRWQRENISMDCGVVLEEGDVGDEVDMRMVYEPSTDSSSSTTISTYIALTPTPSPSPSPQTTPQTTTSSSSSTLHIHRLTHATHLTTPSHPLASYAATTLHIPGYQVLDAKFADDVDVLILLRPTNEQNSDEDQKEEEEEGKRTCLISLPYTYTMTTTSDPAAPIEFTPSTPLALLPPPSSSPSPHEHEHEHEHERTRITLDPLPTASVKHVFEPRFEPRKIVVNGRKGRRVVCVLARDGRGYRVLDLDFGAGEEEREGSEEGEEGEEEGDVRMGGVE